MKARLALAMVTDVAEFRNLNSFLNDELTSLDENVSAMFTACVSDVSATSNTRLGISVSSALFTDVPTLTETGNQIRFPSKICEFFHSFGNFLHVAAILASCAHSEILIWVLCSGLEWG